mmetsp:Transcript_14668/g.44064  ORF Transcript_14668/g.44064 Transcript_14668/m.44064 type:complete len:220 (-) Transcript_14668:45-704(-)
MRALRALLPAALLLGHAAAKIVRGVAQFSSMETEAAITKFSFSPAEVGGHHLSTLQANFHTEKGSYFRAGGRHNLVLALIPDDKWDKYTELRRKGSLCRDRIQGLRVWWKSVQPQEGPMPRSGGQDFQLKSNVAHHYDKSRYFYVLLADCSLEEYNAKNLPAIEYEITLMNGKSHLPMDELGLGAFHFTLALVLTVLLAAAGYSAYKQLQRHGQVHLTA